jgi:hypothetical protein
MLRILFACLLIALPALAQRPPAPPEGQLLRPGVREGYAVDPANGCWAWMSGMPANISELRYTWTGRCPEGRADGPGRSTLTWRENGVERQMIHEGTLERGKAVGRGTLAHMEDGEAVVLESGEFADDMLVQGRIEVPRAGLVYEGAVTRGQPNGRGRMTVQGRVFEGEWRLGCLEVATDTWIAYGRPAESCRTQNL